ncbi:MAG TPA: glycosyltransferase [Caulobacteraceae bacterium]|nr:glycosyltransferase [Caulobacteraceae bacterium]
MPTRTLAATTLAPAARGSQTAPANPGQATKVMLLLGSLDGGGAERVALNVARRCVQHGHEVRLGLLRREGAYLADAPEGMILSNSARGGGAGFIGAAGDIAAMIHQGRPQVLMSFGLGVDGLTALALLRVRGRRPRWIVRADSSPDAELAALSLSPIMRAVVQAGLRRLYRRADAVVAVSEELASLVDERAFGGVPRTAVIHNPLDLDIVRHGAAAPLCVTPLRPFVVAAGRLVRQKGFDLLIGAFAASRAALGMDLVILGEGPLEGELRAQAHALGVGERVRFAGFVANPWAWFARARLFVLSSRWEGFGNVICEAQACGAPVLAADCDFGPREQIQHGQNGWLCDPGDPRALAAAMDRLLVDAPLCAALSNAGRRSAEAFDAEGIAAQYSALFAGVAAIRSDSLSRAAPWERHRRAAA